MDRQFIAAINGINLDNESSDTEKKIEEVRRRAAARLAGSEAALDKEEFAEFGIGFETV